MAVDETLNSKLWHQDDADDELGQLVVVTDLDNTLWVPGRGCPDINKIILDHLLSQKIPVVISTGRSVHAAKRGAQRYGLDIPMFPGVYLDGSLVLGRSGQIERLTYLEPDIVIRALSLAKEMDPECIMSLTTPVRHLTSDKKALEKYIGCELSRWDEEVDERPLLDNLNKETIVNILIHSVIVNEMYLKVTETMQNECDTLLFDAESHFMVRPKHVEKRTGIELLMHLYGWKANRILVLGDGANDAELLRSFDNSVAMIDGHPTALKASKVQTQVASHEGGWGHFLASHLRLNVEHESKHPII